MKLSELIGEYRRKHGLSQRQMAARCGLSTGYISLIEKEINPQTGKAMVPSLVVLNKLANGMGLTLDKLLSMCDDMPVDISISKLPTLNEKPLINNLGNSELAEISEIFTQLSSENRAKVLELSRLYLEHQRKSEK